ncbi:MAG: hypothetical protein Q8O68_00740 [Candidatus Daviesbacteria bacterium]|nr:hypothetical protein [Candidatus Daviesbacteria bacterium]
MYIICTSDDFQPATIPLFEKYWKPLKEKHPGLIVTFYVSPYNQEFGQGEENNVETSGLFKQWYEENKEWCMVELHGNTHTKPPENLRDKMEQIRVINEGKLVLKDYLDFSCKGYKAPFYRMDENTFDILRESDFKWFSQWWHLNLLTINNKPLPPFRELPTHTSLPEGNNPDNIDKIYEQLDAQLTEYEDAGWKYSSFRQIVKEVTQ